MKSLIIIAIALTAISAASYFISPEVAGALIAIAGLSAMTAMIIDGTLRYTSFFKVILFAVVLLLIGAVMRIMHLPFVEYVEFFAECLIVITYTIHFYYKRNRQPLDVLKLVTVILLYSPSVLPHHEYGIGPILLAITFTYFAVLKMRKNVQVG